MRGKDQVRCFPKRGILRKRFLLRHIQTGSGQLSALQRMHKRRLIDQAAPSYVDQDRSLFHPADPLFVKQMKGFFCPRQRTRDDIRFLQLFVQLIHGIDRLRKLRHGCFVSAHSHHHTAKGMHFPSEFTANVSHTHDQGTASVHRSYFSLIFPLTISLIDLIKIQFFDQHQEHPQHML